MDFFLLISLVLGGGTSLTTTPGNNQMLHYNAYSEIRCDGIIDKLDNWYFYKGHIIGSTISNQNHGRYWFVIDESNCSLQEFYNEQEWEAYLLRSQLSPRIWKRNYDDDWQPFKWGGLWILYLLYPPGWIVIGTLCYCIFDSFLNGFKAKRWSTLLLSVVCVIIGIYALLSSFPQSF